MLARLRKDRGGISKEMPVQMPAEQSVQMQTGEQMQVQEQTQINR